jgi:hypothetical protein
MYLSISDHVQSLEVLVRGTKSDDANIPHSRTALRSLQSFTMKDPLYKLSQELSPPHQSDVKAVIPLPGDRIATASRDQSVGIWKFGEVSPLLRRPPSLWDCESWLMIVVLPA